jgi:hypothetical protein
VTTPHLPNWLLPSRRSPAATSCAASAYRCDLRVWDPSLPVLGWAMHDDAGGACTTATVRRCIRFARAWGYGGIVRHLYDHPHRIGGQHGDPVGADNAVDGATVGRRQQDLTVLAWGEGAAVERASAVTAALWQGCIERGGSLAVLGWTPDGQPRHPLDVRPETLPECLTPTAGVADLGRHEVDDPHWSRLLADTFAVAS